MSRWRSMTAVVAVSCLCLFWLAVGPTAVAAQGPAPVNVTELDGNGTATDPYVVTNVSELQAINQSLGANYTLGGDINASETASWSGDEGFVPIGNSTAPFTGSFNGSEYRISNLTVNRSQAAPAEDGDDAALFGSADGATISNLTVINATISAGAAGVTYQYTGTDGASGGNASGLVAVSNATTITGVSVVDSNITAGAGRDGDDRSNGVGDGGNGGGAGGVIATATRGSITDVVVINATVVAGPAGDGGEGGASIGGGGGTGGSAGGIAGQLSGTTVQKAAVVRINVSGGAAGEGGLGDPSGPAGSPGSTGGVIGYNDGGTVSETDAQGTAEGTGSIGGLVGVHRFSATVDNSSARVDVTGTTGVGGIVGQNFGTVSNAFATGRVTGSTTVGGLAGGNSDGTVSFSYWDTESTNQSSFSGETFLEPGSNGGLSTSQLTGTAAESNMNALDFASLWVTTDNYPRHRWAVENLTLAVGETTITDEETTAATVSLSLFDGSTASATTTASLTSTDSEVLTVSGSTITAAGTGTAQITATVAGHTDSVSITVEASEDEDSNDSGGGGGSSSSSSSDDDDDSGTTTVSAVDTTDEGATTDETIDDGDETSDETDEDSTDTSSQGGDTVRVSSASASVRGGSTLEITLPSTDESDEPADGDASTGEGEDLADEPADDETDQSTDDTAPDDGATDGEAGDGGEANTDPNQPPPPPVSQAEIERVEIDVSEDVDADVEIRQSRSPPSDDASEFRRDDGTQAAGYIQVTDNLDDDQVTEGRLTFRVSKADLETDEADPENVALYHYIPETGEWEELDTEVVGESDDYVRFRGTTPGFSQFAAGIKRAQFEISDALVNVQQITLGDSIQVEAIVTNTGGADGTFTTQLLVDSEVVAEDVLTIASGGQRATIFDHEFDQADTYQVRVNDVITGEIQVTNPNAAAESTDDSLPGFGFGTALVTLVVSTLLYRRRAV